MPVKKLQQFSSLEDALDSLFARRQSEDGQINLHHPGAPAGADTLPFGEDLLKRDQGMSPSLLQGIGSGSSVKIIRTERVAGGDINQAYRLMLSDGTSVFMKSNTIENASFFTTEAAGLNAIAHTNAIGTPQILGSGVDYGRGCSFLLLEFITAKKRIANYWETFAQELACMHQAETTDFVTEGRYGFIHDNYIGAKNQKNAVQNNWCSFFRDCRLKPQFESAAAYFDKKDRDNIDTLLERLDEILIEPEHPSLLHGDLWSGNVITGNDGKAWLIDPAVYVGHAEADIAMTELFGGFPPVFYAAYREASPMYPDYEHRRDLYNLYHLLNHLNLFGPAYLSSVKRVVEKYSKPAV